MLLKSIKYGWLTLGKEIAQGGEGIVYETEGHPELAIKLYNSAHCGRLAEKKIKAMVEKGTKLAMPVRHQQRSFYFTSWPLDALYTENNSFCGFVMPRFNKTHSIICACRLSEREKLIPRYHYSDSITLALNLASEVAFLHSQDIIVGDLNWKNIGFNEHLELVLFDADSFTFKGDDGTVYKTRGGFSGLLPPELLGLDLSKQDSIFTKESDNFQLSILIWCLLMDNYHPFVNRGFNTLQNSSANPSVDSNIARGICPCLDQREDLMPKGCPDYHQRIFLKEMREGFERTFRYDASSAVKKETINRRTSAAQWVYLLKNFLKACQSIKEEVPVQREPVRTKKTMQPYKAKEIAVSHSSFFTELCYFTELFTGSLLFLLVIDILTREKFLIPLLKGFGLLWSLDFFLELKFIVIAAGHGTPLIYLLDRVGLTGWRLFIIWIINLFICYFFAIHHYGLF